MVVVVRFVVVRGLAVRDVELVEVVVEELELLGSAASVVVVVVVAELLVPEVELVLELLDEVDELEVEELELELELELVLVLEVEVEVEVAVDVELEDVEDEVELELDVDELELVSASSGGLAPSVPFAKASAAGVARPATVALPPAITESARRRQRAVALTRRPIARRVLRRARARRLSPGGPCS